MSDNFIVPVTTGHFIASDACRCSTSANSAIDSSERAEGDGRRGVPLLRNSRRHELGDRMQADRRTEHDRQHDGRADAEAAPHALRQIALQHRLVRMQRVVKDGDDGADRIFGDGFGNLEISKILADADAVVAQLAAGDGIFVDDVGEVAFLEAMPPGPVAVEHLDLANLGLRHHHLARGRRPFARGAHLQRLVNGGSEEQPERGEQHRVDEPRQVRQHGLFPQRQLALDTMPPPRVHQCCGFTLPASAPARCRRRS